MSGAVLLDRVGPFPPPWIAAIDIGSDRRNENWKSGMIGVHIEISEEKRLVARLMTSATRFDSDEYCFDLCQGFRVITL